MIFTITGPSGCGKTTLVRELQKMYPDRFCEIVSTTSRPMRDGEVNGRDYHFVDREWFKKELYAGNFLEHVEFGGNYYGVYAKDVGVAFKSGKHAVIIVDRKGAEAFVRRYGKDMVRRVYISADPKKVINRLVRRDGWSKAKKRVKADEEAGLFDWHGHDCVLRNDSGKRSIAYEFNNFVIAMEAQEQMKKEEVG